MRGSTGSEFCCTAQAAGVYITSGAASAASLVTKRPLLGLQKASVRRGTNVTLPQFGRWGLGGKDLPNEWSDAIKSRDGLGEHAVALEVTVKGKEGPEE